ncbi:RNI-like protein [Gigaspora margarita]|uniref:RNI-like protein n=1 Tax=Gigaspora margarita TaxID=4874 RepID=A0A8H3XGI1_GIGMA|nr:RNI-like protein [Gigaspora margarita]
MNTLPKECLLEIFDNFRNQYRCLFYCLLVNRLWCKIIIPILWRNPTDNFIDRRVLKLCLSTLNEKEQARLIPFRLNLPKFPKQLFEYTSYATTVKDFRLSFPIKNWLKDEGFNSKSRDSIFDDDDDYLPIMVVKFSLIEMFLRTRGKLKLLMFDGIIFDKTIFNNFYGNANITTITSLEFWPQNSNSEAIEMLVEIIRKNFLISLNLSNNEDFSSKEWNAIAEAFHQNTTITSLDLSSNQLDFIRAKLLAEVLYKNTTLTKLDIGENKFESRGSKVLAKALHRNNILTSLRLSCNDIDFEGGKALAEALCVNTTLIELELQYNELGIEVLAEALCKNISLSTLNLSWNGIDSRGVKALEKVLYTNSTLTYLNLSENHIGFEDSKVLIEALSKNVTLMTLHIGRYNISYEDRNNLRKIFRINSISTFVDLISDHQFNPSD